MNSIVLFFKSFLVGIGKIIPGVSGAMIAISLGIYEDGLNALTCIKKNIKFIIICGLGISLSIIMFGSIIKLLIDNFYLQMMLLFSGIILGGTPNIKIQNLKYTDFFIIAMILALLFTLLLCKNISHVLIYNNVTIFLINLVLAGFIDAFATIVPGISGTALLIMFGYYDIILSALSNIYNLKNMLILFSYFVGFAIGIFVISYIVKLLIKKYQFKFQVSIMCLSYFSVIGIILQTLNRKYNMCEIAISICLLVIGYKLSKKIIKKQQ